MKSQKEKISPYLEFNKDDYDNVFALIYSWKLMGDKQKLAYLDWVLHGNIKLVSINLNPVSAVLRQEMRRITKHHDGSPLMYFRHIVYYYRDVGML